MGTFVDESLARKLSASLSTSGLGLVIDAQQGSEPPACSEGHIEKMAECGRLPGTKFGRGWILVTAQLLHHVAAECAGNLRAIEAPAAELATDVSQSRAALKQSSSPPLPESKEPPKRRGRPRRPLSDAP